MRVIILKFIKEAGYYNGVMSVRRRLEKQALEKKTLEKQALDWTHGATAAAGAGAGSLLTYMMMDQGKGKPAAASAFQDDVDLASAEGGEGIEGEDYIELSPGQYEQMMQMYYQNPYGFQQS